MIFVMKPPSIAIIAKLELPKFRIKGISPVPPSCNTVPNAMILIYCVAYASTCPSAPKRPNTVWAEKKVRLIIIGANFWNEIVKKNPMFLKKKSKISWRGNRSLTQFSTPKIHRSTLLASRGKMYPFPHTCI